MKKAHPIIIVIILLNICSCGIKSSSNSTALLSDISSESTIETSSYDTSVSSDVLSSSASSTYTSTSAFLSSAVTSSTSSITTDPYKNITQAQFYASYTPACSYEDAQYRTLHCLISGSNALQDQKPTIASNEPQSDNKYLKDSDGYYTYNPDKSYRSYVINTSDGKTQEEIYYNGGYVSLEEVAAYVYAFGDVPPNQFQETSFSLEIKKWGIYGRENFNYYSSDTSKYPYEPDLPDSLNGSLGNSNKRYYEMDVGTTGTDCDPRYPSVTYNTGTDITRGAARIVFTYLWSNGTQITSKDDRYVFYTYNHYNDFQEYLNYYGGWGKMFGSVTAGNPITDFSPTYPPTAYPETESASFSNF